MSDEKQTAVKALMLMGTLLAYIKIHEQTMAIDKIKREHAIEVTRQLATVLKDAG